MKNITTEDAVKKLQREFKKDLAFRQAYESTISCCLFDELEPYKGISRKDKHAAANAGAKRFIDMFIKS